MKQLKHILTYIALIAILAINGYSQNGRTAYVQSSSGVADGVAISGSYDNGILTINNSLGGNFLVNISEITYLGAPPSGSMPTKFVIDTTDVPPTPYINVAGNWVSLGGNANSSDLDSLTKIVFVDTTLIAINKNGDTLKADLHFQQLLNAMGVLTTNDTLRFLSTKSELADTAKSIRLLINHNDTSAINELANIDEVVTLPPTGGKKGDMVKLPDGQVQVWDGSAWIELVPVITMTPEELDSMISVTRNGVNHVFNFEDGHSLEARDTGLTVLTSSHPFFKFDYNTNQTGVNVNFQGGSQAGQVVKYFGNDGAGNDTWAVSLLDASEITYSNAGLTGVSNVKQAIDSLLSRINNIQHPDNSLSEANQFWVGTRIVFGNTLNLSADHLDLGANDSLDLNGVKTKIGHNNDYGELGEVLKSDGTQGVKWGSSRAEEIKYGDSNVQIALDDLQNQKIVSDSAGNEIIADGQGRAYYKDQYIVSEVFVSNNIAVNNIGGFPILGNYWYELAPSDPFSTGNPAVVDIDVNNINSDKLLFIENSYNGDSIDIKLINTNGGGFKIDATPTPQDTLTLKTNEAAILIYKLGRFNVMNLSGNSSNSSVQSFAAGITLSDSTNVDSTREDIEAWLLTQNIEPGNLITVADYVFEVLNGGVVQVVEKPIQNIAPNFVGENDDTPNTSTSNISQKLFLQDDGNNTISGVFEEWKSNTLLVDVLFGNNLTAVRARQDLPYLNITGAYSSANSEDNINITKGNYLGITMDKSINLDFDLGSSIASTINNKGAYELEISGRPSLNFTGSLAVDFDLGGSGRLDLKESIGTEGFRFYGQDGEDVFLQADKIQINNTGLIPNFRGGIENGYWLGVNHGCNLHLDVNEISTTATQSTVAAIYASGSDAITTVNADYISLDNVDSGLADGAGTHGTLTTRNGGQIWATAKKIENIGAGRAIYLSASTTMHVEANEIRVASTDAYAIAAQGVSTLHIHGNARIIGGTNNASACFAEIGSFLDLFIDGTVYSNLPVGNNVRIKTGSWIVDPDIQ